jgi:hypothetical protein
MRMRCWAVAAVAVAAALVGAGRAAAQPEPTVEVRLRSVNDLLDKAEYVGGVLGQDEPVRQARELVKQLSADGKGVEGIDPKRPFGAYAVVTQDVANSPVVIMVPIADEERFLQALKDRAGIVPEKGEAGTHKIEVPFLGETHLKFANGYLYAARDPKHIAGKDLVTPKAFFAKDDGSALSVLVRVDRIPDDLKELFLGQFEMGLQQGLKQDEGNAAEKKFKGLFFDSLTGGTKMVLDDAKEVSLKVFVDPKGDDLSAEFTLTPKAGTPLAKTIAGLGGKPSLPAGIVAGKNTVGQGGAKLEMTPEMKKKFATVVDDLIAQAVKEANANEREVAQRVLDTLAPTFKSGELDAAAALVGPDAKGFYRVIAAASVKDGKEIEKLLKEFAPHIPPEAVEITFDADKVGKFAIHKVVLKDTDDEFDRIFGTKNLWLATSDDCVAVSVEPDGATLKAGLEAKPVTANVLNVEVSLAKVLPLAMKDLKPDEVKALIKDAFGNDPPAGKDTINVSVTGGDRLTARLKVKGKALRLATTLEQARHK